MGLNVPCATSVECLGGTICQSRLCQCPPVYTVASFGCVQAPYPYPARPAFAAPFYPSSIYPAAVQQQIVAQAPLPIASHTSWSFFKPEPAVAPPSAASATKPGATLQAALTEVGVYFSLPGASCVQNKVCVGNSFCNAGSCVCATSYSLVGKMCVLSAIVLDTTANATTQAPSNETTNATTTHSPVPVQVPAVVPETLAEALKTPDPSFEANPSKLVELKTAAINYLPVVPAPVFNQFVAKSFIKAPIPTGLPLLAAPVPVFNNAPAHVLSQVPLFNPAPLPFLASPPLSAYNYLGQVPSYYAKASPNLQQYNYFPKPNPRLFSPLSGPIFSANLNPYFNLASNYLSQYPFYPFTQKKYGFIHLVIPKPLK